jgi:hypothetical protein
MDPLSATTVAAFAIQVVDFGARVISKSVEFLGCGELVDNAELERVTSELSIVCQKLEASLISVPGDVSGNSNQAAVLSLGKDVASQLLGALQKLKSTVNQNKWRSFRQALLAVWHAEHIEALLLLVTRVSGRLLAVNASR